MPGIVDNFSAKKFTQASVSDSACVKLKLQHPIDISMAIVKCEPTVDNLITALGVTSEKVKLLQLTVGQSKQHERLQQAIIK